MKTRVQRGSVVNRSHTATTTLLLRLRICGFQRTRIRDWWSRSGSNRRHPACKAGALPAELRPLVVGLGRFELPTPRLSSVCSNQLSYRPPDPDLAHQDSLKER